MSTRVLFSSRIARGMLVALLSIMLGGCDLLRQPPVSEWPGPHAPYPFPDNIPHRTE